MSLSVSLPTNIDFTSFEQFTLYSTAPASSNTPKFILRDAELIFDKPDVRVFRVQLTCPSTGLVRDAVCKLAYGGRTMKRLAAEARFYSGKLSHLQGVCIPRFYGHFLGECEDGPVSCIVLEYCGEDVYTYCAEQPIEFKRALIYAVIAIHEAGVRHFDLRNRNVVNYNGLPMIIDFGEAEDHECERQMEVEENVAAPIDDFFGCDEIHQLCIDLGIWKPGAP
ncbi:hypothetical protein DENSPDRAFT_779788 [Dentipellis sp. KUC8613]|nr:hypothetical protein DENSPDRAFT_779788 [Dentipellis sp. KUC8613]